MVMQADPIYRCYDAVQQDIGAKPHVIYMSPKAGCWISSGHWNCP